MSGAIISSPALEAARASTDGSALPVKVRISFVIAMFEVAQYLPVFLESIDGMRPGAYELECIFVDDGSTDESATLAAEWLSRTPHGGQVVAKQNGGVSSARNAGLDHATGDWVSFPDPDDFFDTGYLAELSEFLLSPRGAAASLVVSNVHRYFEDDDEIRDTHALRFRFRGRAKNVNLVNSPHYIQLTTNSSFVRLGSLRRLGIRFNERISNSEDALFVSTVLAMSATPIVGIVPKAIYLYRKRSASDSAVDVSFRTADGYINRYKYGYLPFLQELRLRTGETPEWLGNLLLYEFRWMFARELKVATRATVLSGEERSEFFRMVEECLQFVRDEWILGYRVTWLPLEIRYLLLALKGSPLPSSPLWIRRLDQKKHMLQIRYYFVGQLPREEFRVRAKLVEPAASKVRTLKYFDQELMFERIVWLPATSWLAVDLDGQRQELRLGTPKSPSYALTERDVWSFYGSKLPVAAAPTTPVASLGLYRRLRRIARKILDFATTTQSRHAQRRVRHAERLEKQRVARVRSRASSRLVRHRFANAWVFMDRLRLAQDNAEHLYRYVVANHQRVNAWYVIMRDAPDWARLKKSGFRLVAYGSRKHTLLMLNAAHVISSHINVEQTDPIERKYYPRRPQWRFTFLQHGITKDDLSAWLNGKDPALFITATRPEFESLTADFTPYVLTTKEVALTGFPRHDALLNKRALVETQPRRRLLLVAPTWRDSLLKKKLDPTQQRELVAQLHDTDYARAWFGLLRSPELLAAAAEHDLEVAFLPHPELQAHIGEADMPPGVKLLTFATSDVQDLIVSAELMITDYSSLAFEAAFLDIPVVYFQFDRESVFGGGHTFAKGYFDYQRDGFGPVTDDINAAVCATRGILANGGNMPDDYRRRAASTFALRDGQACKRTYEAIAAMDDPITPV